MVLLIDDDSGGVGHLTMVAELVTPDAVNFMATHGRGLVCLALSDAHCRRLGLADMPTPRRNGRAMAYTVSIEAARGVTTGISAADRAVTILAAVAPGAKPEDLVQPGHIFPVRAAPGGVLERAGFAEAASDLAALAGAAPAAVTCCVLDDSGEVAGAAQLQAFAREHGLRIGRTADVLMHRALSEPLVVRRSERTLHTAHGSFRMVAYQDRIGGGLHLALINGDPAGVETESVPVHTGACLLDAIEVQPGQPLAPVLASLSEVGRRGAGIVLLVDCEPDAGGLAARLDRPPRAATIREVDATTASGADRLRGAIVAGILGDLGAVSGDASPAAAPAARRSVALTMAFIEY
jgi:3,4-dihydroxy 2-butanone 4-phosphate synthase/GTP cyclohydrolase II